MYIYKITVVPLNQIYIGFDTHPSYKLRRWKTHCKNANKHQYQTKLYQAMSTYGVDNCTIDIIEDHFTSITQLALAEIEYIKKFDSFKSGLNSTRGGDGLGRHVLHQLSDEDILKIKNALGDNFSDYNKQIKWAGTTIQDRKNLTKHLHTEEVYQKKSDGLKKFYENNPTERDKKKIGIVKWQQENRNIMLESNRKNSLLGAKKTSKKLRVEHPDGNVVHYPSKSEFQRQTKQWAETIINKTNQGVSHNGFRAWEE